MDAATVRKHLDMIHERKATYPYPLATKKVGCPRPEDVQAVFPSMDFSRIPFQIHVWWGFKSQADRTKFMDWILYDPEKHHPANVLCLDDFEHKKLGEGPIS